MMQRADECGQKPQQQPESFPRHLPREPQPAEPHDRRTDFQSFRCKMVAILLNRRCHYGGAFREFLLKIIDRVGDALALAQGGDGALPAFTRCGQQCFEIVEERLPVCVVEMDHHFFQATVEFVRQRAHRLLFFAGVCIQRGADVNRLADAHPDRAAKTFLALKIDADRNDLQSTRAVFRRLHGDARRAGADLFDARQVVGFAFGKNADGLALHEIFRADSE